MDGRLGLAPALAFMLAIVAVLRSASSPVCEAHYELSLLMTDAEWEARFCRA